MAKLRIIGGQFRGRKLVVPDTQLLRPTGDRVRETLFNWLMHHINSAYCLDLFAGTGALGIEALSRGAKQVTFIERDRKLSEALKANLNDLNTQNQSQVLQKDAIKWLKQAKPARPFDIVFIDPPFSENIQSVVDSVYDAAILHSKSILYIEQSKPLLPESLPEGWQMVKHKKTGQVYYHLIYCGEGMWKSF